MERLQENTNWNGHENMKRNRIIEIQQRIGAKPDGFWGPKSIAACQAHLRRMMPTPNPWPAQTQTALTAFYGAPGDTSRHTAIDVRGLGLRFDGQAVSRVTCHQRVAESLLSILTKLATFPEGRRVMGEYAGVYENRLMRGGTLPSLHARAAAIDLAPATNGNNVHWPSRSDMSIEVMEVFAQHGWLSAGAFWSRDSMHFQATK
jgi:hypothetical protein